MPRDYPSTLQTLQHHYWNITITLVRKVQVETRRHFKQIFLQELKLDQQKFHWTYETGSRSTRADLSAGEKLILAVLRYFEWRPTQSTLIRINVENCRANQKRVLFGLHPKCLETTTLKLENFRISLYQTLLRKRMPPDFERRKTTLAGNVPEIFSHHSGSKFLVHKSFKAFFYHEKSLFFNLLIISLFITLTCY